MVWLQLQQHNPQSFLSHGATKGESLPVKVTAHYAIFSDRNYCCLQFQHLTPGPASLQGRAGGDRDDDGPSGHSATQPPAASIGNFPVAASLGTCDVQAILNVLPVPSVLIRLTDDQVLGANVHLTKLFELPQLGHERYSLLGHYLDSDDWRQLLMRLDQEATICDCQIQVQKADQTQFKVSVSLQKLTVDGKPVALCTFHDLSEHQRTEEALRRSEARFRTLAETTNTIIFIRQGKQFSYINPAAQVITGYKCEELLACPDIYQLIKERGRVRLSNRFFFPQLFPQYEEVKILTKTGEECWLDCSIAVTEFDGKPAILGTAIDITQRKQAEAEIRNALIKERELNELKSHFISMVSHEFRSPLNIIAFSVSSLRRFFHQWSDEKKLQYLSRIQASVEKVDQLLDQTLLLGRTDAGKVEVHPTMTDLVQFCDELVADMQLSDNNNHPVECVHHGKCSVAWVDEKLLHPILTNLLSNALKYSPANSPVKLEVWIEAQHIVFQVSDHGIGVPIAEQPHLFELFHRGSNVGSILGSGLGLAVVKRFVEIQNGQITFTSEPGIGTTCRVTLPVYSEGG